MLDAVSEKFPARQHYAHDAALLAMYPSADLTVDRIGDLLVSEQSEFFSAATVGLQEE
jgi:hypothetical protein